MEKNTFFMSFPGYFIILTFNNEISATYDNLLNIFVDFFN